MKILFTILALAAMLFASKAEFIHDYDKALEMAKAQNKDIYMLVTSDDCRWCRKFETLTLNDEQTMKNLKEKYILLSLNRDKDKIPAIYKVKRVPKHFFLTKNGEIIYACLGFWNPDDFASFMDEAQKKK